VESGQLTAKLKRDVSEISIFDFWVFWVGFWVRHWVNFISGFEGMKDIRI